MASRFGERFAGPDQEWPSGKSTSMVSPLLTVTVLPLFLLVRTRPACVCGVVTTAPLGQPFALAWPCVAVGLGVAAPLPAGAPVVVFVPQAARIKTSTSARLPTNGSARRRFALPLSPDIMNNSFIYLSQNIYKASEKPSQRENAAFRPKVPGQADPSTSYHESTGSREILRGGLVQCLRSTQRRRASPAVPRRRRGNGGLAEPGGQVPGAGLHARRSSLR